VDLLPKEVRAKIAFFRSWCLLEIQTAMAAPNCAVVMRVGEPCTETFSADGCPRFKADNGMPKALTNLVDIAQVSPNRLAPPLLSPTLGCPRFKPDNRMLKALTNLVDR
jgi:hypothetical protein